MEVLVQMRRTSKIADMGYVWIGTAMATLARCKIRD